MNLGHYNSPVFYQSKQLNREANLSISHPLFCCVWGKTYSRGIPGPGNQGMKKDCNTGTGLSAGAPVSLDPQEVGQPVLQGWPELGVHDTAGLSEVRHFPEGNSHHGEL